MAEYNSYQSDPTKTNYQNLKNWQDQHEKLASEYHTTLDNRLADLKVFKENANLSDNMSSIFEKFTTGYTDWQFKQKGQFIGNEFDFANGKDVTNEKDYNDAIASLAQAEIDDKDTDKDGEISLDEYVAAEIASAGVELTEEETAQAKEMATALFNSINGTDDESDTTINADEMQAFYETLDKFNATGEYTGLYQNVAYDGVADGKINISAIDAYLENALKGYTQDDYAKIDEYKNAMENGFTYDLNNKEEELTRLAEGEILTKDLDGDGVLSLGEYTAHAVNSLGEEATVEEKAQVAVETAVLFDALRGEDDYLDATEVAKSYKYADKGSIEGEEDGKVEANGVRDFAAWFLPNSGNSQEYIDALYEGYLGIYS